MSAREISDSDENPARAMRNVVVLLKDSREQGKDLLNELSKLGFKKYSRQVWLESHQDRITRLGTKQRKQKEEVFLAIKDKGISKTLFAVQYLWDHFELDKEHSFFLEIEDAGDLLLWMDEVRQNQPSEEAKRKALAIVQIIQPQNDPSRQVALPETVIRQMKAFGVKNVLVPRSKSKGKGKGKGKSKSKSKSKTLHRNPLQLVLYRKKRTSATTKPKTKRTTHIDKISRKDFMALNIANPCPAGSYRNPKTNRCRELKQCPRLGQTRDAYTRRCRKILPCKEGKMKNLHGRCVLINAKRRKGPLPCKEGKSRNSKGRCVLINPKRRKGPLPCKEGKSRNTKGRCVLIKNLQHQTV